jgi:hypothetical protein
MPKSSKPRRGVSRRPRSNAATAPVLHAKVDEGMILVKAFAAIDDDKLRQSIVRIAMALAEKGGG